MSSAKVELSYLICSALIFDLLMLASDGYWRVLETGCSPVQGITIEYETRSAMAKFILKLPPPCCDLVRVMPTNRDSFPWVSWAVGSGMASELGTRLDFKMPDYT